ncbi:MAG: DNA primase [Candidatus Sumerlaeia bacterium]|nr:DNA primase [Candidatus Sumerlaeia bacterium]
MASLRAFADQLRNTVDIVEVVSAYVPLKRRGKEGVACCPFHNEKTPSFKVNPAKQIYHCFGCRKGGDVIRFIMEVEHLDWTSAVRFLAERHGLAMPQLSAGGAGGVPASDDDKRRMAHYELHKLAAQFFSDQLHASKAAMEYLDRRGVTHDIVEAFHLGWAPDSFHALCNFARKNGYSVDLLREAGLVKDGGEGRGLYDVFRARVMFPICDQTGRIVAFGGRILTKDPNAPKYLNSPETPIYQKGRFLYAYHLAKNAIKERGYAIITEGYMDAIACHQYGFTNTVASLGTAFTDAMARLLRRLCLKVVFLYDGDEAGQKAMYNGTQVLLAHDFQVRVVALPPEDDPDSLLRSEGREALARRIEQAPDHFEYFLQAGAKRFDRNTLEGRMALIEYLAELVGRTQHPLARHEYVRRLSEFLAVPESVAAKSLFGRSGPATKSNPHDTLPPSGDAPPADRHETGLLRLMIEHAEARAWAQNTVNPQWLFHPQARLWFERILSVGTEDIHHHSILRMAESEEDAAFLRALLLADSEPLSDFQRVYPEIAAYLASRYYDCVARDLAQQIAEAEKAGDTARLAQLMQQKVKLSQKRRQFGEARYGKWHDMVWEETVSVASGGWAGVRQADGLS